MALEEQRERAHWRLVIWRDFFGYDVEASNDVAVDNGDDSDDDDPWQAAADGLPQNPQEGAVELNTGGLPPIVLVPTGGLPPFVTDLPTGGLPPSTPPSDDSSSSSGSSGSSLDSGMASSLTEEIADNVYAEGVGLPREPSCWDYFAPAYAVPDVMLMMDDGDTSVNTEPSAGRPPTSISTLEVSKRCHAFRKFSDLHFYKSTWPHGCPLFLSVKRFCFPKRIHRYRTRLSVGVPAATAALRAIPSTKGLRHLLC